MAKFKIEWSENKSADWKIISIKGDDGKLTEDVSVNRVNKKGEIFPGFDEVKVGNDVEGELWKSTSNKHYLFAPKKVSTSSYNAPRGGGAVKAAEITRESVKEALDTKENSIRLSGAMRDAVLIVTTFYPNLEREENVIDKETNVMAKIIKWRNWILNNYGDAKDTKLPF